MRLKDSPPDDAGYFIRASPDAPERGPLTLENLRDLAEFKNLTPEYLIRSPGEAEYRLLAETSELAAIIFPQRKTFGFKSYQKTDDPDAALGPVDARGIYRCDVTGSPPRVGKPSSPLGTPPPPPLAMARKTSRMSGGTDVQQTLALNQQVARERMPASPPTRQPFSMGRVFSIVRWVGAAIFIFIGIAMATVGGGWMAYLPIAFALLLICIDLIGGAMGGVESWIANSAARPADYSKAEAFLEGENWGKAAQAFLAILRKHPKELHAYVEGMASAAAANDQKKLATFRSLAQRHLQGHDLNLLNGSLSRRGLPVVPPRPRK